MPFSNLYQSENTKKTYRMKQKENGRNENKTKRRDYTKQGENGGTDIEEEMEGLKSISTRSLLSHLMCADSAIIPRGIFWIGTWQG